MDTFHGSKGDFPVTCAVTSFKIRNLYILVILAVIVHLPELVIYMYIRIYIYVYIYIYIYIYIYDIYDIYDIYIYTCNIHSLIFKDMDKTLFK